ncbi:MAG: hypothetical protein ACYTFK_00260 [Planctomycetota bacterium]|jgi:hypothetical protein
MAKRKSGLHRKVSSIFDGVSVPKSGAKGPDQASGSGIEVPKKDEYSQRQSDFVPKDIPASPRPPRPVTGKPGRPVGRSGLGGSNDFNSLGPIQAVSEKRRKTMMVLMVALFIVLVLVLTSKFSKNLSKKKAEDSLKPAAATAVAATSFPDAQVDWEVPQEYPKAIRDPMETTWSKDPVTGDWIEESVVVVENGQEHTLLDVGIALRSILWAESGRSIVVGNEILSEGDTILGVTIKKINKDSVEFEKDGVGFLKVFPR